MLIGLWAAAALAEVDVEAEGALLLLLLLQAASASPAAMTALRRRHRRVAGIDGTAKLLCALSQGCGLAVVPVSRVAARLTGFSCMPVQQHTHALRERADAAFI